MKQTGWIVLFLGLLFMLPKSGLAAPLSLRLLGVYSIATGTQHQGVEFGGISGLDLAEDGSYWALSDEPGGVRGTPRFYNLSLNYDEKGFSGVSINSQAELRQQDGTPFSATARTVDPESIRRAPNGNLYWTSEGIWNEDPEKRRQPFLREMKPDGDFVREFSTPPMYGFQDNSSAGGRSNKLLEALAVSPSGVAYFANEDALIQDGDITTLERGSVVRLTALNAEKNQVKAQYAYALPRIPEDAAPGSSTSPENGLSEILALSDTQFIAVERAFAPRVGNTIRLVWSQITPETTDISGIHSLQDLRYRYIPMTRNVLLEMPIYYQGIRLDNIESISWGRVLENGRRTLVMASDNNYSATQETQFIAFEVIE